MKWYTGPEGDQRIWYELDDIERIVDDELARAGLTPRPASPVTDIERFIESHLKADLDQYADLPPDVLGLTRFVPGRRPAISINTNLTDVVDGELATQGLRGRWRATFAHEAAHVLLHRYLFEPDLNQSTLFDVPNSTPAASVGLMRCLKRDVTATATDWREVQANRGMAALLMPRTTFRRVTFQRMAAHSLVDVVADSTAANMLAADLAQIFDVSAQAAAIRLEGLGLVTTAGARLPGL